MSIRKFGSGEVTGTEGQQAKTAATEGPWTKEDDLDLQVESGRGVVARDDEALAEDDAQS